MAAFAEIDLAALRRYRRPGIFNVLSRQRLDAYAESYRQTLVVITARTWQWFKNNKIFQRTLVTEEQVK